MINDSIKHLSDIIAHLDHVLPGQAPIKDFVHHNTLHGYQHLQFQEALAAAGRVTGASGYLPLDDYREFFRNGRVNRSDLKFVLNNDSALKNDQLIFENSKLTLTHEDIYIAALCHPIKSVTGCQLNWNIDENHALEKIQDDVDTTTRQQLLHNADTAHERIAIKALWQACLTGLKLSHFLLHPEDLFDLTPERLESLQTDYADAQSSKIDNLKRIIQKESTNRLQTMIDSVGEKLTLSGLITVLTGRNLMEEIRPYLVRQIAAFLDQGVACWNMQQRHLGFYTAWRQQNHNAEWRDHIESLPEDATETIIAELRRLDIPEALWNDYLTNLALELPGWSGMFNWRAHRPEYNGEVHPVAMADYLAVRIVVERLCAQKVCADIWNIEPGLKTLRWYFRQSPAELMVRHSLFNTHLPEYLIARAQQLVNNDSESVHDNDWWQVAGLIWTWQQSPLADRPQNFSVYRNAWPLFRLAQHLGLSANEISSMSTGQFQQIFDCLANLDTEGMGFLWLQAYEHNYREKIFDTISQNHGRGQWQSRLNRPDAQIIFCMDDREESTRRYLEELNPNIETMGAAGFFGLAINWLGLDDSQVTPLCPVVVQPSHEIQERPDLDHIAENFIHQRRRKLGLSLRNSIFQEGARNPLSSLILNIILAPLALSSLVLKVLNPRLHHAIKNKLWQRIDVSVQTEIITEARTEAHPASPEYPRLGFTDQEQAEKVAGFLRTVGLQQGLGKFVVLMGHGSSSVNNPHLAAYDCGACSGRHGGPNARAFAKLANRPKIRRLLGQQGLHIPDDTWFIGADHNTGGEDIIWYDRNSVPESMTTALSRLQAEIEQAKRSSAQERCRRLASAPVNPSPKHALQHVQARAEDISQARPELGHATNALAIIGRRSVSRGTFLDRRVFLISYDPTQDPDGSIVESILLNAGPVGAGINLEYYFSTVNNEQYGCGSKITHNVSGMLGVMEGTSSDLRTGLPKQMIEIHEAMRLQVMVEASTSTLTMIYDRQPALQELVGNGWLLLSSIDPDSGDISILDPAQGWSAWQSSDQKIMTHANSTDCYKGHSGSLAPALIETSTGAHA